MEADIGNGGLRPNYMGTDDVYLKTFLCDQDRFKRNNEMIDNPFRIDFVNSSKKLWLSPS